MLHGEKSVCIHFIVFPDKTGDLQENLDLLNHKCKSSFYSHWEGATVHLGRFCIEKELYV